MSIALILLLNLAVGVCIGLTGIAGFLLGPIGFLIIEDLLRLYGENNR